MIKYKQKSKDKVDKWIQTLQELVEWAKTRTMRRMINNKKHNFENYVNKKVPLMDSVVIPEKLEDPCLPPDPLKFITNYVSRKVKHEKPLIRLITLVMASAYTPNPLNLALESPQSEGKSYPLVEVAELFPTKDVWDLGGMTPQVLTRERGYYVDRETGKSIEEELARLKSEISALKSSKEDKEKKAELKQELISLMNGAVKIVDMQGKILLFLEAPSKETFARLRPILSRDKYEIEYKFVDIPYKNGPQVTMEARIRGWPVAIYATADSPHGNIWDQIRSRFIVVSPNMKKEKYKAANQYTASKYGSISNPSKLVKVNTELKQCKNYIYLLKKAMYKKFVELSKKDYFKPENVSFTWNPMAIKLEKSFPSNLGQNMRDFKYFMALMDVSCLFSLFHRPYFEVGKHPHWIVTKWDLKNVIEVFDNYHFFVKIGELPIKIFEEIILKMELNHKSVDDDNGFSWKDLRDELGKRGLPNGKTHVQKNIISPLEQVGLLCKVNNRDDNRYNVYVPFHEKYEQLSTNSFLKIKYGPEDFKRDFNQIKNKQSDITPITINQKSFLDDQLEFVVVEQFGNHIFYSLEKSLKPNFSFVNRWNCEFVYKSLYFKDIQDDKEYFELNNSDRVFNEDVKL